MTEGPPELRAGLGAEKRLPGPTMTETEISRFKKKKK